MRTILCCVHLHHLMLSMLLGWNGNQKELTQALQQLANALGKDKAYCYSEDFLNDFMSGLWQPFEEVSDVGNRKQSKLNTEIQAYKKLLEAKLDEDGNELLGHYVDLLGARNGEALDYAFLVGYQCAFRFLMLGLSAPSTILPEGIS